MVTTSHFLPWWLEECLATHPDYELCEARDYVSFPQSLRLQRPEPKVPG